MTWWRTTGAILSILIAALMLTACGWDGRYRYLCQDPQQWNAPECKPPLCIPSGTCTRDLLHTDG